MAKFIRCDKCKKEAFEYAAAPAMVYYADGFMVEVTVKRDPAFKGFFLETTRLSTHRDLCRECVIAVIERHIGFVRPQM